MTINTQIHQNDGTKTTNTICEEKSKDKSSKTRRKLTAAQKEKTQAARRELVALTKHLKEQQKAFASQAASDTEAAAILDKKPNDLLKEFYLSSTGASELKTFKQWKDDGYHVKKNEKCLRVWGKPFKATSAKTISTPDGAHTVTSSYDLYPMVALYTELQVAQRDAVNDDAALEIETSNHETPPTETAHDINAQQPLSFDVHSQAANDTPSKPNLKLAARLRNMGEKLQKDIDKAFAERQENTPKRIAEAARARQNGYRFQRTQQALIALASRHEQGNVIESLQGFTTKKAVYDVLALRQEPVTNGYHSYYVETSERVYDTPEAIALWTLIDNNTEEHKAREAHQQKINAAKFTKIPGYFPTPASVVDRMCELADIQDGHTILEPEAGSGAILDRLTERYSDLNIIGFEMNSTLFDIVSASYSGIRHDDFLTASPDTYVDRIVMNPPFEQLQDVDHVQHAYTFLKPGGKLVAIMSPSAFFREDKKSLQFRAWFAECNGYEQDLPEGSFKASGTNVNTKLILIEKPESTGTDDDDNDDSLPTKDHPTAITLGESPANDDGHIRKSTASLIRAIKEEDQDFEWYPTTDEIIETINKDIEENTHRDVDSILDCGAGDGRVLEKLTSHRKYAIEKSKPLLEAMDKNIFIVGTEFSEQVLIDKKVDVVFSNPPYSEYEKWAIKIITQANAAHIYLVIPDRWQQVMEIQQAIDTRDAETTIIGSFDFLNAERKARANVHLVRIDLCYVNKRYSRRGCTSDPFKLWFDENFKLDIAKDEFSKYDIFNQTKDRVGDSLSTALVEGNDLISALENLYQHELVTLLSTYKKLETIDPHLLKELNVNIESVRQALQLKIEGLKDIFWKELFDRLDKVTNRLTKSSRERLLSTLTEHTHVDFTASNAYAIVIWVIKNSNHYFDDQLIHLVETMTTEANIQNYASNQRTFGREEWRYGRTPDNLARYKLDYRIVLERSGGLCNATYSFEKTNSGLSQRAGDFLNDLCTIATNIGFDTTTFSGAHSYHWETNVKNTFLYRDHAIGENHVLFEARAFKNGNLHLKLNQALICRLNVEFGRLKGWIKSAKEAADELNIPVEEATLSFRSNHQLEKNSVLALTAC